MAVLTDDEKKQIRQNLADYAEKSATPITWTKPQVNQAAQVVEDDYNDLHKQELIDAIESALPGVFPIEIKRRIVRYWKKLEG